jgi:hypothetical protein
MNEHVATSLQKENVLQYNCRKTLTYAKFARPP